MRLLSISSHVAHGHVGNAAQQFPLQRLGAEVLAVHTVQYSNHLGYPSYGGASIPPADIAATITGLTKGGLLAGLDGVISGFLGEAATVTAVAQAVATAKAANPKALYCFDPVLGDDGRLYAKPEIVPAMIAQLLPLADLLTPNLFELGLLTQSQPQSRAAILAAAQPLLAKAEAVLVTSAVTSDTNENEIDLILVTAQGGYLLATPRLPFSIVPNGCGDLIAALFLFHRVQGQDAKAAAEAALSGLFGVLSETSRQDRRELLLVAAQQAFVTPSRRFVALPL